MSEDPKRAEPEKGRTVRIEVSGEAVLSHVGAFSYGAIKDAKRRVLQNLFRIRSATVVDIVTDTTLPFDLVSDVVSDLETQGKVTIKIDQGFRWVELKK